jgi:hypothetical protein
LPIEQQSINIEGRVFHVETTIRNQQTVDVG